MSTQPSGVFKGKVFCSHLESSNGDYVKAQTRFRPAALSQASVVYHPSVISLLPTASDLVVPVGPLRERAGIIVSMWLAYQTVQNSSAADDDKATSIKFSLTLKFTGNTLHVLIVRAFSKASSHGLTFLSVGNHLTLADTMPTSL